jgi:hypothetical protein
VAAPVTEAQAEEAAPASADEVHALVEPDNGEAAKPKDSEEVNPAVESDDDKKSPTKVSFRSEQKHLSLIHQEKKGFFARLFSSREKSPKKDKKPKLSKVTLSELYSVRAPTDR